MDRKEKGRGEMILINLVYIVRESASPYCLTSCECGKGSGYMISPQNPG